MIIADSILFPGLFCETWLTHHSGLADAEIQLITGLSHSESLAVCVIDEEGNAEDWLMKPLVDQLVAAGVLLQTGQCYSFLTPPVLGGDYTVQNTVVLPISEHYGVYGSYHEQLRGVPDGTKIVIKVEKPPASN
jgi:hypothetical protein